MAIALTAIDEIGIGGTSNRSQFDNSDLTKASAIYGGYSNEKSLRHGIS